MKFGVGRRGVEILGRVVREGLIGKVTPEQALNDMGQPVIRDSARNTTGRERSSRRKAPEAQGAWRPRRRARSPVWPEQSGQERAGRASTQCETQMDGAGDNTAKTLACRSQGDRQPGTPFNRPALVTVLGQSDM